MASLVCCLEWMNNSLESSVQHLFMLIPSGFLVFRGKEEQQYERDLECSWRKMVSKPNWRWIKPFFQDYLMAIKAATDLKWPIPLGDEGPCRHSEGCCENYSSFLWDKVAQIQSRTTAVQLLWSYPRHRLDLLSGRSLNLLVLMKCTGYIIWLIMSLPSSDMVGAKKWLILLCGKK